MQFKQSYLFDIEFVDEFLYYITLYYITLQNLIFLF